MIRVRTVSFSLGPFCAFSRFEPETLVLEDLFMMCALQTSGLSFLDVVDSSLWIDLSSDAQEFEAESWSLVVDPSFCSRQEKDVIKRQDVIFGEHFKYAPAAEAAGCGGNTWTVSLSGPGFGPGFIIFQLFDLRQTMQLLRTWTFCFPVAGIS
jgi:hypothetical protein